MQTLGCTACSAPRPCFLVVRGNGCAGGGGCGGGRGGVASFLKVWVFDSVPYSLKLKNSPISNSFHMDVLWCGNCFSLYSVWCFAIGTLYSCSLLFFSSWLYNGSQSYLAGGRKLVLIWIVNVLVFVATSARTIGFKMSVKNGTLLNWAVWHFDLCSGCKWLSKQRCHVPS